MSCVLFELFLTDADLLDLLEERKILIDLVYKLPKILFDLFLVIGVFLALPR